jgi:hypothetical protein
MKIEATLREIRATLGRIPFYLLDIRDEMGEITAAIVEERDASRPNRACGLRSVGSGTAPGSARLHGWSRCTFVRLVALAKRLAKG